MPALNYAINAIVERHAILRTNYMVVEGEPRQVVRPDLDFEALYRGTWRLEPALSDLRITLVADGVAQIYVPIMFTIGAPGQEAQKTRFLMNQVLLKTPAGWKVASILPIPAPAQ